MAAARRRRCRTAGAALRQLAIVSFIAVGIVAGALFVSSAQTASHIRFLELGVAILLFLAGHKLGWRLVRTLGPVASTAELWR